MCAIKNVAVGVKWREVSTIALLAILLLWGLSCGGGKDTSGDEGDTGKPADKLPDKPSGDSEDPSEDPVEEEEVIRSVPGLKAAGVRWVGRVDTTDEKKPRFSWSGSGFIARFTGTEIAVKLKNDSNYFFQPVLDGKPLKRVELVQGEQEFVGKVSVESQEHVLEFYRETEGIYGASQLLGVTVQGGELLEPPQFSGRTIEIIGDSISCGYGNLGDEKHWNNGARDECPFSRSTESAYQTYGWLAARKLHADVSIVAVSGYGMYQSNGKSTDYVMPKYYQRVIADESKPSWNFNLVTPQVVVINLGTNDFFSLEGCPTLSEENFKKAYLGFVGTVRKKYPQAWIFCTVGPMLSDWYPSGCKVLTKVKKYVQSVVASCAQGGDSKIRFLEFNPSPDVCELGVSCTKTGCRWHPNVSTHQKMADILVKEIKALKLSW